MLKYFTVNVYLQVALQKKSAKPSEFMCTKFHNIYANVEIFQSGPKWWTDQQNATPRATRAKNLY